MATKIYINTDLKDLTANAVANKNRPTQVVRLPQIVEGETLDVELSLVNSGGGYDTRSGDATVSLAVAVSARGAAATSGTFTLTASTETTAPLAWNASAEAVEGALNALNGGSGAYGSKVDVKKLNSGSYRIIFKDVGARTDFGGTSIDLAPESEVTIATAVVGSATIRAQMIIEINQQPAIFTSTWTTGSSKFSGQLNANTARVQELIATGQDAFFEVKADNDVICQVPIAVLPAVAAPNSLPAHTLPSDLCDFAADPSTNGCFNATNWLTDLLSPHLKAVWGSITGTLSDQTDLQAALDAKGSASQQTSNSGSISANTTAIASHTSSINALNDDTQVNSEVIAINLNSINSLDSLKAPKASPIFNGNVKLSNATSGEILFESANTDQAILKLDGGTISLAGYSAGGSGGLGKFLTASVNGTSIDAVSLNASSGNVNLTGSAGVKFTNFTSISRSTDPGTAVINPVQNFRAGTNLDTLANLCLDSSGNVVRGSQEATFVFNRTQLNALTGQKINLLSAPGSGKCIVIEDSHWLIEIDPSEATAATPVDLTCEIVNFQTQFKVATQLTAANLNTIAGGLKTAGEGNFGMYSRDVPQLDRISQFDKPMTIRAKNSSGVVNFPDNFLSVKLKIKYRVWDSTTF